MLRMQLAFNKLLFVFTSDAFLHFTQVMSYKIYLFLSIWCTWFLIIIPKTSATFKDVKEREYGPFHRLWWRISTKISCAFITAYFVLYWHKKKMNSCKGVSNTVAVFDIFLWSNCHNQTLSIFFLFCQVVETPSWIFFSFAVGENWNIKNYISFSSPLLKFTQL